ncbi:MAG: putative addiction module antidote protein [Capsulimonadaceae bacterium]|nr:putative addiction module antidote protein [Capsulimonadaceae bacterium]
MKFSKFEDRLHEKLRDDDYVVAYLEAALENGGVDEFLYALREVAIANGGVSEIAAKSRHGRESLYKSLSRDGNPRIKTLDDILHTMGLRIAVTREETDEPLAANV